LRYAVSVTLFLLFVLAAPLRAADFDADRAFFYLEAQVAFGPRNPESVAHEQCLQYLKRELEYFADAVVLQPFTYTSKDTKETLHLTNIIGRFAPQAGNRVLLCAHWDSRPRADQDGNPANHNTPIPAANDGASGVAVLLEVARQLADKPAPVGVDIAFWDGEDYGREGNLDDYLIGSDYYSKNMLDPTPRFVVLLDMVGDKDLHLPMEGYSQRYASPIVAKVYDAAKRVNATAFERREGNPVVDDHLPFLKAGIPAIDLIDFDYPYWHTLDDVPANCSAASLGQVGRTLLDMLYHESTP
jgi:hypothetical protein